MIPQISYGEHLFVLEFESFVKALQKSGIIQENQLSLSPFYKHTYSHQNKVDLCDALNSNIYIKYCVSLSPSSLGPCFFNKKGDFSDILILKTRIENDLLHKKSLTNPRNVIHTAKEKSEKKVIYEFQEMEIPPGEEVYFKVPQAFQSSDLSLVVMSHRQNPKTEVGTVDGWDKRPGLTSVQVFSEELQDWRYWKGKSSGEAGAKFADVSSKGEIDALYKWETQGHCSVIDNTCEVTPLKPKIIKVKNVGSDTVLLSELSLDTETKWSQ
jgi:hypothetical protein